MSSLRRASLPEPMCAYEVSFDLRFNYFGEGGKCTAFLVAGLVGGAHDVARIRAVVAVEGVVFDLPEQGGVG